MRGAKVLDAGGSGRSAWIGRRAGPQLAAQSSSEWGARAGDCWPRSAKEIDSKTKTKNHRLLSETAVNANFAAVDRLEAGSSPLHADLPHIKTGTSRTDLRARYGDPTLNISSRREGRLIERLLLPQRRPDDTRGGHVTGRHRDFRRTVSR